MSIKRYNNCINIYELPDCSRSGKNYELQLKTSVSDLKTLEFEQRIRSIDRCHNRNKFGQTRTNNKTSTNSEETPSHNNNFLIIIIVVGGLVFSVALAVAGSIYGIRLRQGQRRIEYILTEKEIHEFMNGYDGPLVPLEEDGGSAVDYAYSQPYDTKFEIPRELISMGTDKLGLSINYVESKI